MKAIAIKDFKYSFNGFTVVQFKENQIIEVDKIHFDRMKENKYIKEFKEIETKVIEPEETKSKKRTKKKTE